MPEGCLVLTRVLINHLPGINFKILTGLLLAVPMLPLELTR